MIRLGSMLPQAFMIGIIEMVNEDGPEKTARWLTNIGKEMAKTQGPGLEGSPLDGLNYLPLCPFADELIRFIDIFGEHPEEFLKIMQYAKKREAEDKNKVECPAVATFICLLHNAYRKKRAKMAGYETIHLACKAIMPGAPTAYNEEAIKVAGITKEEVDNILQKGSCVFKFIKKE